MTDSSETRIDHHEEEDDGILSLLARDPVPIPMYLPAQTASYMYTSANPTAEESAEAMALGAQHSFAFAFIAAIVRVAIAFFIRRVIVAHGTQQQTPMH